MFTPIIALLKNQTFWAAVQGIASVFLLWVARVGFKQLETAKKDIALRSKREAIGVAIDQVKHFADVIVPMYSTVMESLAQVTLQPGVVISDGRQIKFDDIDEHEMARVKEWIEAAGPRGYDKCVTLLNCLEAYAMNFTSRLADREVAYNPTANSFCTIVVHLYPVVIHNRLLSPQLYSNLIELFQAWTSHMTQAQKKQQVEQLKARLRELRESTSSLRHPEPLGVED